MVFAWGTDKRPEDLSEVLMVGFTMPRDVVEAGQQHFCKEFKGTRAPKMKENVRFIYSIYKKVVDWNLHSESEFRIRLATIRPPGLERLLPWGSVKTLPSKSVYEPAPQT